ADHLGGDAQDLADAVDEEVAVRGVAGGGGRHEAHVVAGHAVLGDELLVAPGGVEGALDGDRVEAAGAVHAEAEPDHLEAALEVDQRAVGLPAGDQQADGVGAAVDGGDGGAHRAASAGSSAPQRQRSSAAPSIIASTWSATGLTPGPSARACPARACRHLTRVGM